jgi:hypothetical protein
MVSTAQRSILKSAKEKDARNRVEEARCQLSTILPIESNGQNSIHLAMTIDNTFKVSYHGNSPELWCLGFLLGARSQRHIVAV